MIYVKLQYSLSMIDARHSIGVLQTFVTKLLDSIPGMDVNGYQGTESDTILSGELASDQNNDVVQLRKRKKKDDCHWCVTSTLKIQWQFTDINTGCFVVTEISTHQETCFLLH